jgi:hypothetical protein
MPQLHMLNRRALNEGANDEVLSRGSRTKVLYGVRCPGAFALIDPEAEDFASSRHTPHSNVHTARQQEPSARTVVRTTVENLRDRTSVREPPWTTVKVATPCNERRELRYLSGD